MSEATVENLFSGAASIGMLGPEALEAVDIEDLGEQIQAGLGISPDDVQASEVTLVALLIDDSSSIRFAGHTDLVREGHNLIVSSLAETKQKDSILIHNRYLNGQILYPFVQVGDAEQMDTSNYDPVGGTPLYDQAVALLATVAAKCQEFANSGVPARAVIAWITDGADQHSLKSAQDVAVVAKDLLMQETFIIIGMGISDGGQTDFREVFRNMGVEDEWILTPGNSPSEIRKAFAMVSQSSVQASQGAQSFSETAMGGFGS